MEKLSAEHLFGEICVRLFFCTRRDLDRALKAQYQAREAGSDPAIGEVMRGLGILTADQVEAALKAQTVFDETNVETLYGRIALKNKLIRPADLEDATRVQQRVARRLRMGEILVKRGHLTWEQHDSILRLQERLLRQMEIRQQERKGVDPKLSGPSPATAAAALAALDAATPGPPEAGKPASGVGPALGASKPASGVGPALSNPASVSPPGPPGPLSS